MWNRITMENGGKYKMVKKRELPSDFINDLKDEHGLLHPFLEQVKSNETLMLSVRDKYINIYYRGGNLLRLTFKSNHKYEASFDWRYNKSGISLVKPPTIINEPQDVEAWVTAFPVLRNTMDFYFSKKPKTEREYQQLIARENNYSPISNETEYFITDIEFADSSLGARSDMLAVQWPASERKNGSQCRPVFIELKYGDEALKGNAGILKHLQDFVSCISDRDRYQFLLNTIESQFKQLDQLELLKYKRPVKFSGVELNRESNPEVIFVLANHNPRSYMLADILKEPLVKDCAQSPNFDLRFFVASAAGYGFHRDCMLNLDEFQRYLNKQSAVKRIRRSP